MFASLAGGVRPENTPLSAACKTQNRGPGSRRGPPCPLVMNCRKGHHGLLLRKPAAKSKTGRGERWEGEGALILEIMTC